MPSIIILAKMFDSFGNLMGIGSYQFLDLQYGGIYNLDETLLHKQSRYNSYQHGRHTMTVCHESYMLRYIENIFLVIQQNGCVYLFQSSPKQRQYIPQEDGDEFGIRK